MSLRHMSWPSGDFWTGDEVAAWAGSVAKALSTLPKGVVEVRGAEGIDAWIQAVADHTGHRIGESRTAVLDLTATFLAEPNRLLELADEASVAVLVHPEHSAQAFDLYATIHRHSLFVSFTLWGSGEPVLIPFTEAGGDWTREC